MAKAKFIFFLSWLLLLIPFSISNAADDVGRYQCIALPRAERTSFTEVVILDTKDGHIWTWTSQSGLNEMKGGNHLTYEGQVKPGKKAGDKIDKRE